MHSEVSTSLRPVAPLRAAAPAVPQTRHRVGDAERAEACDELSTHYAAGRLTADDLQTRLDAAMGATYLLELHELLQDLPPAGRPEPTPPAASPSPWRPADIVALLVVMGSLAFAALMLVVLLGLGSGLIYFIFGGTVSALGGGALVHLMHTRCGRS